MRKTNMGSNYLLWVTLLLALLLSSCVESCVEEERLALLEIKAYMSSYSNPKYDALTPSWFGSGANGSCCEWYEVVCNSSTGRVTQLYLSSKVNRDYYDAIDNPWRFNITLFQPFIHLISLDLSHNGINSFVEDDGSSEKPTLKNLLVLKLEGNNFQEGYISFASLTSLRTLTLNDAGLVESSFKFEELTNLIELQILDLGHNYFFSSSLRIQEFCIFRNLVEFKLEGNEIWGGIPPCLQNMSFLQHLDLSHNHLVGMVPIALSNMKSLKYIDLSKNYLEGKWSLSSLANHSKLQVLWLSGNKLQVETEDLHWQPTFQLQSLGLHECKLNNPSGTIPKFLLYQNNLSEIDLSYNNLVGSFPSWLFLNNSGLRRLGLANNSLAGNLKLPQYGNFSLNVLDISRNNIQGMVPDNIGFIFSDLILLNMSDNHLEGHIPTSVGVMRNILFLDFSDNNFSGEIPRSIFVQCNSLLFLLLSNNNLQGELMPEDMNLPQLMWLKLSNNHLSGTIMKALQKSSSNLHVLDISSNKVTGKLPRWIGNLTSLFSLSMSKNGLTGQIPKELCKLSPSYLDLSENHFSGGIPSCSNFSSLQYMHMHGNSLTGTLPISLSNSSNLIILDLRDNHLFGNIPYWIHKLYSLIILLLGGNTFHGNVPHHLCQLNSINLLDLSNNHLTGEIPTCFGNISFGTHFSYQYVGPQQLGLGGFVGNLEFDISFSDYSQPEEVKFLEKNQYLKYIGGDLAIMSGLDLSCNKLTGDIPSELGHLKNLHSLNISHNHLTSFIPPSFSNLLQIESLDLSYNNLSGPIPSQLIELNFLSIFNVSYNNLSGRVPQAGQFANFDERNYYGNPRLYGFVSNQSHNSTTEQPLGTSAKGGGLKKTLLLEFLWSFGMSCAIMFLATVVILWTNHHWRQVVFDFVDWHFLWWTPIPLVSVN